MQTSSAPRVVYFSGPVDAIDVYDKWANGVELGYFGTSYLKQYFEICKRHECKGYVITTLPGPHSRTLKGDFLIENLPGWEVTGAFRYHFLNSLWMTKLLIKILLWNPTVVLLTAGQTQWHILSVLKLRNITIIPVLHCLMWVRYKPSSAKSRLLTGITSWFFRNCCSAIATASEAATQQVRSVLGQVPVEVATFLPSYRRDQFSALPKPDFNMRPFRVYFAGRIVENKGVFDLVKMARWVESKAPGEFKFDVCGDGPQLEELRSAIDSSGLTGVVLCHGYCERAKLTSIMAQSHIFVVPTTKAFEEGFNMVCAEGSLAGRPVVTSDVCPALFYIAAAAVQVEPDNVDDYIQAIWRLANDRDFFEQKCAATKVVAEQFYDDRNSYGECIERLLLHHLPGEAVTV